MQNEPKVSIIMGIYNCESTLATSIDSILAQTYENWELIMCDDGSKDGTYALAKTYADRYPVKIVLLRNEKNMRLSATLNHCLTAVTGEMVARMDGDDLSRPDRLRRQVDALLSHPEVQLVGTAMRRFDDQGYHEILHPPMPPESKALMRCTPFFHATILTYKKVYDALGGYCTLERADRVEDIDLWFRFYEKKFVGMNIDEPLYEVRDDISAVRRRTLKARIHSIKTRANGYKLLGFPMYKLIRPAVSLFVKGLVPPRFAAWYRTRKAKKKE